MKQTYQYNNATLQVEDAHGELNKRKEQILFAMGIDAVRGATLAIYGDGATHAVDTGRLGSSLSFVTQGGETGDNGLPQPPNARPTDRLDVTDVPAEPAVVIGSNVEYARFVEEGTSKMAERPFLRVGIEREKANIKKDVENILGGGAEWR